MSQNRTESQRAAARANGAKSHGPTSPSGKRISSMNARKHGLYANTLVLPDENRDSFLRLCADLHLYLSPRDPLEDILVHRMIAARWRSQRCQHFENAGMTVELSRQGDHKEYPLDGQVLHVPAARAFDAYSGLHSSTERGSFIELSEMRQSREFDRAYLQLVNKRERERRQGAVFGREDEKGGNEPGHSADSKRIQPLEKPGLQPGTASLEPAAPLLKPENSSEPELAEFPDAA